MLEHCSESLSVNVRDESVQSLLYVFASCEIHYQSGVVFWFYRSNLLKSRIVSGIPFLG